MSIEQDQDNDINSRLKARLKPSVPSRKTSLLKREQEEQEVEGKGQERSEAQEGLTLIEPQERTATSAPSKMVSFTLRVEEGLEQKLKYLCSVENITKETFLEAAYLVCAENAQLREQVLSVAKQRRANRRKAGVQRRAKAMSKYLPPEN